MPFLHISRRQFVKSVAASALGNILQPVLGDVSSTQPSAWGEITDPTIWPMGTLSQPMKILEVHLYGGLSPWETFYLRNRSGNQGWRGFFSDFNNLNWNATNCTNTPSPVETHLFDSSDPGHEILLGPATKPLWRQEIRDRMRVIVLQHDLLPHEAAIPYALSGFRLGNPKLAGLGAPIQRRALAIEENKPIANRRTVPFSYCCQPATFQFPADNLQTMTSSGLHPGSSRPVNIKIGPANDLIQLLNRNNMTSDADAMIEQYRSQYRDLLRYAGAGDPVRSRGFSDYSTSISTLLGSPDLLTMFATTNLNLRTDWECASETTFGMSDNIPGTGIRIAADLLAHPTTPAHYVCVVDSGLKPHGAGGGYDTHNNGHVLHTAVNLWNTLSTLEELIVNQTINLDETMIVLTTEFGRTPNRNINGRDHWPQGYVNVLIGGPITTGRDGVIGRIEDSTGIASSDVFNPSDVRAAILLSAGIFPFAEDLFGIGDISASLRNVGSEEETAKNIRRAILGVPG